MLVTCMKRDGEGVRVECEETGRGREGEGRGGEERSGVGRHVVSGGVR